MFKKINRLETVAAQSSPSQPAYDPILLRLRLQQRLESIVGRHNDVQNIPFLEDKISTFLDEALVLLEITLSSDERQEVIDLALADARGFGLLQPLLDDDTVTEIMVNGPREIYVERGGLLEPVYVTFEGETHLRRVLNHMVEFAGRRISDASPMVNARLPNGQRLNAVIPPLAVDGTVLTIRKFARRPFTLQDLINNRTLSPASATFIRVCVEARINIVISGSTGAGKTTLLNLASNFIPARERVVTIEDTAELQFTQAHVVRLEARPPDVDDRSEVTIRQLLINALRMRPDRIVIGECRGSEALDMLQAMNTGHDGSLTTVHSNGPRDTVRRIELMTLTSGLELPQRAIREMITSAIELIIHIDRMRDGSRRVTQVSELAGLEGDVVRMTDLFVLDQTSADPSGTLHATGLLPKFEHKFIKNHVPLPKHLFSKTSL